MRKIDASADQIISGLLACDRKVCILDSCGVGYDGSHLLVAGIDPVETVEFSGAAPGVVLDQLDEIFDGERPAIFTLSYEFGAKLQNITASVKRNTFNNEPDAFVAIFDSLLVHDYETGQTILAGDDASSAFDPFSSRPSKPPSDRSSHTKAESNFSKQRYISAAEEIKELIRAGDTYQTNLTQQIRVRPSPSPETTFWRLRRDHPSPFSAFVRRPDSTVVSASPERFFRVAKKCPSDLLGSRITDTEEGLRIEALPIKGTRRRGAEIVSDKKLKSDLLNSEKDRAENTMIVDLLRNDLGRVCEFGGVAVEELCKLVEFPTLFHLVSTISGTLEPKTRFSAILRAMFPCGSITGAPKIRTMQIIDQIETATRGLSMGAIGCYLPATLGFTNTRYDLSVAIRTIVFRDNTAEFNVGGGITIDSCPEAEYEESLLKAKALLAALDARLE